MRFKQYLQEKTFAIGQDVDFIYNKAYKNFFNTLQKKRKISFKPISMASFELKSKQSKKADSINPITIYCLLDRKGNFYDSIQGIIHLTPNPEAIGLFLDHQLPDDPNLLDAFENELNGSKMKETIYHELSHWLDDSLHNRYIKKSILKAHEIFKKTGDINKFNKAKALGHEDINADDIEINAQIHNIKQLKRNYRKVWDELGFLTMLKKNGSLYSIYLSLSPKEKKEWVKKILKRMNREKLLGKNMRKGV